MISYNIETISYIDGITTNNILYWWDHYKQLSIMDFLRGPYITRG
jgi:hypothetical protein